MKLNQLVAGDSIVLYDEKDKKLILMNYQCNLLNSIKSIKSDCHIYSSFDDQMILPSQDYFIRIDNENDDEEDNTTDKLKLYYVPNEKIKMANSITITLCNFNENDEIFISKEFQNYIQNTLRRKYIYPSFTISFNNIIKENSVLFFNITKITPESIKKDNLLYYIHSKTFIYIKIKKSFSNDNINSKNINPKLNEPIIEENTISERFTHSLNINNNNINKNLIDFKVTNKNNNEYLKYKNEKVNNVRKFNVSEMYSKLVNSTIPFGGNLRMSLNELIRYLLLICSCNDNYHSEYGFFPTGFLLSGPPGVGKTYFVKTLLSLMKEHFHDIINIKLFYYNDTENKNNSDLIERNLNKIFENAYTFIRNEKNNKANVSIIFLDEIDTLYPNNYDNEKRLKNRKNLNQLLTWMNELPNGDMYQLNNIRLARRKLIIIGATNLPNEIDPSLRGPGRFDREIHIEPPTKKERYEILKVYLKKMNLIVDNAFISEDLPKLLIGYVGADIKALCREASILALSEYNSNEFQYIEDQIRSIFYEKSYKYFYIIKKFDYYPYNVIAKSYIPFSYLLKKSIKQSYKDDINIWMLNPFLGSRKNILVKKNDFLNAMNKVGPSLLRDEQQKHHYKNISKSLDDIAGEDEVKQEIIKAIEWPLRYEESYKKLGIKPCRGILLYGPPGCSKTSLVIAIVKKYNYSFYKLTSADIYSAYFGDSEKIIRETFQKARTTSPSIIFFDEIDTIVTKRFDSNNENNNNNTMEYRICCTLLNEMDGMYNNYNVIIIGATNRPDKIDYALLRPGRFDKQIYIPLPNYENRKKIFKHYIQMMSYNNLNEIDFNSFADKSKGFSGAEIENLCREAAIVALKENSSNIKINKIHLLKCIENYSPCTTENDINRFEIFKNRNMKKRNEVKFYETMKEWIMIRITELSIRKSECLKWIKYNKRINHLVPNEIKLF